MFYFGKINIYTCDKTVTFRGRGISSGVCGFKIDYKNYT
jgi:hypothetical protein